ncbi:hypothetical protein GRF29_164g979240 [Pseudopithomyces chartarum]|uniref:D-arabinitol 2-dehydrogenase [ribulose-forming] n=1 Tax=Pseudopithomyces chartarum TaxID=1892770 RepID=A0AAN6LTG9_9PLEO|nr:hypothetical protein GRF29_164g979240 [Pseudopithomyces chartarum]
MSLKSDAFPSSAAFEAIQSSLKNDEAGRQDAIKKGGAIFAFTLKNKAGATESWYIDLKEKGEVGKGEPPKKANVTLSLSDENFGKLVTGKANAQKLFMSGALKVKGDVMKATKMEPILKKAQTVTGASQGLGQQILAAFALSGAHGAVVDLKEPSAKESIETIQKEIKHSGLPPAELRGYECDTSSEKAVKSTWEKIVNDFGKVDILVTNAGITGGAPAEDYPFEEFKTMINVNLNGTFLFARAAGKYMIENSIKGNILMVSSMSGTIVNRPQKQAAYNASKAAATQLMKSLAAEWAPHGIRVNALSPGYIQTTANEGEEMEKLSKEWIKDIPLARIAKPHEFRGTAVYLCSDASSYMTGSEIVVDGGYLIW